jgi:DNA helicase-2/ATP-dependent DNA helicase PcrA
MSLHKSKGLSAPFVFVAGCVEGLLPGRADPALTHDERVAKLQEDRRLFYVGITRVKATPPARAGYLALTCPQTMLAAEAYASQIRPARVAYNVAYLHPSRFFRDMAPHVAQALFDTPL